MKIPRHLFEHSSYIKLTNEKQLELLKEYFPIGTRVIINENTLSHITIDSEFGSARVVDYLLVRNNHTPSWFILKLDKRIIHVGISGGQENDFNVHPSQIDISKIYIREKKIDKLIN